jgi:hypothetical protein
MMGHFIESDPYTRREMVAGSGHARVSDGNGTESAMHADQRVERRVSRVERED